MTETYSQKRYVSICLGCGGLFDSVRRDQMTCSSKCRTHAHRTGAMKKRRTLAEGFKVAPASIGQAAAIDALLPDMGKLVMDGILDFDEAMPALCREYDRLAMKTVRR